MNSFNDQHRRHNATWSSFPLALCGSSSSGSVRRVGEEEVEDDVGDDLVSRVVPAVTVVLEGRSICHRISLHKHESYRSLAKALRKMFVQDNTEEEVEVGGPDDDGVDLSNAIPGHLVAYEDIENDLLLAGDLNWRDFVRVAKRIRILPAKKGNSRKNTRAV
ncbi:auxin-responsive protein IAA33-like [Neltuma alba]|uniref:auxin-responsive protein IAA33-like n=1 Tax=Neltuma alba TaxID=207710 RepID=UPI0010A47753|nr:auxin-responsive protein IAA33-like [Prosopis alba]XP_028788828.1 auxin-responsive protein IAA33-like [Prosopis alba]